MIMKMNTRVRIFEVAQAHCLISLFYLEIDNHLASAALEVVEDRTLLETGLLDESKGSIVPSLQRWFYT